MKRLLLGYFLFLGPCCYAQDWQSHAAMRFNFSSTFFLGDLGGKDAIGTNDISDLNLEQTRYAAGVGVMYHFSNGFSFGANGFYARLSADDKYSNTKRARRRLHVITDVYELGVYLEYHIPTTFPILKDFYVNAGIGMMHFTPMAEYEGVRYDLRPLGTEGQNYKIGVEPYGFWAPVAPFGFGYKFHLNYGIDLSIDMSLRKSFTDYLDDVSTDFADVERIRQESGDAAAYLANPSQGFFNEGDQRGDPTDNDQFFLLGVRLEVPLILNRPSMEHCNFEDEWKPKR